jgi:predicted nucleic acid-binding protein
LSVSTPKVRRPPLLQAGIFRQPMTERLASMAGRFVELGLTGYDACYAALARDLNGTWLTFDDKAHRSIRKEGLSSLLTNRLPEGWLG